MKKKILFICSLFVSALLFSQGSIQGFAIDPASPTTTDYVKVYVDLMFNYGGCHVYNQNHSISGSITDAYAHHCFGMLTYICNTVDTFNLGYLPVGNHEFRMVLTSGSGGPPCTPGIVVDDIDTTYFTVTPIAGVNSLELKKQDVLVYPNPFVDKAKIIINSKIKLRNPEIRLIDILGNTFKIYNNLQTNEVIVSRENLVNGLYFYQLIENGKVISTGRFIIE